MKLPRFIRGLIFGLITYLLVITLRFLPEVHALQSLLDLAFLRAGAPATSTHFVAIIGAIAAALTQQKDPEVPSPKPEEKIIRGPRFITYEEAQSIAAPRVSPGAPTIFWGGLWLPATCGTQHFSIIGDPGSGKTKSIHLLLKSVLSGINPGGNRRAIIYDAKRDLLSVLAGMKLSCPVQTLNPFDKRGLAWNMAEDIPDAATAIEIATILVPERSGESQPFFPNAARALLSGVMESFLRTAPKDWTFRDVVLALRYPSRTRVILKRTADTRYLLYKYVGENRSDKDIASTLENTMRRLSFIAGAWHSASERISLSQWLNSDSVLVLGSSPSLESSIIQLNSAIIHRLSQLIRELSEADRDKGKPNRQIWIVIDELREAGRLDGLHTLVVEGRSKGACIVIGFQDLPGLRAVYQKDLALEISGLFDNKAFLRISEPDTQEWASKQFGTQEVDLPKESTSSGESYPERDGERHKTISKNTSFHYERQTRPLLLPAQFKSDLRRPEKGTGDGIKGYYQTALVHSPYAATLPTDFIDQNAPRPDPNTPDVDRRTPEELDLDEWSGADLERLKLTNHPELLKPKEMSEGELPEDGWINALPTSDDLP